ncbi:MAG TPA: hypothetical protein VN634_11495 [Candidatus Limnocylindrales bacterium]|nr:hypothetical protein [Candidatus Limnocylindrales bacterium]
MKNLQPAPATIAFAALTILCATATTAQAIDHCKVKVDKKTGVILVDASGVTPPLLWGSAAGQETNALFNAGTCVADGKAKKCQLADPLTLASKTPPAGCTLYLDDGAAPCTAWIAGCTPSPRSGTGALVKDSAGALIGYSADSSGMYAVREESGDTVRLAMLTDGSDFQVGGYVYYLSNDCTGAPLMPVDLSMIKQVAVVSSTLGIFGPGTGTSQLVGSVNFLVGIISDQAGCDSYFGPGVATFVAPHGCCELAGYSMSLGNGQTINLGQFVPPFSVDLQ